jgi:hypothetical protein
MLRWPLLLLFFCLARPLSLDAQEQLIDFTKVYFRSNPFAGTMRQFLEHLTQDPMILDKKIQQRTQQQLFSFSGRYSKYPRFFFAPDSVKVALVESTLPFGEDNQQDTILIYQITAFAPPGAKGKKDVIKEWEKIKRTWSKRFFDREESDNSESGVLTGQFIHLFLPFYTVSPLTLGWTTVPGPDRQVLTITMRLKQSENMVDLPGALNNSQ